MSVEYESSCVGCPSMGMPCQGPSCRNYNDYPVYHCDKCGSDGDVYEYGDQQLCSTHLRKFAWEDSKPTKAKKCEGCGCTDEEVREYADGRVGCEECIGDWAIDEAEVLGDFWP